MTPEVIKAIDDELVRVGEYGRVELTVTAGRISRIDGTRQTLIPPVTQAKMDEAA